MLNRAEFNQLKSQMLSHLARTMYLFYLRPSAPQGAVNVDPVALTSDLVSHSAIMPCNPTLELIEGALLELEQEHLIARVMPNIPWQGALVIFPLYAQELMEVPHAPFRMYAQWQPGPSFRNAALMAGLVDYSYQEPELISFINFWLERGALHNQYGWERLFIQRLLKLRSANTLVQVAERRKRRLKSASELRPNTIKSSHAQDAVLPASVTKRGVNNESRVRSNHYGTTQQAEQLPTLRGMLSGTPQYEAVAAGYTDEVSKELMAADGTLGYQTFSAAPASSTGELLPRFDGSTAPATLATSTTQQAPKPSTEATPAAPKDSLAPAGGFDLEYLKELDAAFATTSNSDLLAAQAPLATATPQDTAASQATAAPQTTPPNATATSQTTASAQTLSTTEPETKPVTAGQPRAAAHAEVLPVTNSAQPPAEGTTPINAVATAPARTTAHPAVPPQSPKATQRAQTKRAPAPAPKTTAKRGKQAAGGYQRMDFGKLGIEAELS